MMEQIQQKNTTEKQMKATSSREREIQEINRAKKLIHSLVNHLTLFDVVRVFPRNQLSEEIDSFLSWNFSVFIIGRIRISIELETFGKSRLRF